MYLSILAASRKVMTCLSSWPQHQFFITSDSAWRTFGVLHFYEVGIVHVEYADIFVASVWGMREHACLITGNQALCFYHHHVDNMSFLISWFLFGSHGSWSLVVPGGSWFCVVPGFCWFLVVSGVKRGSPLVKPLPLSAKSPSATTSWISIEIPLKQIIIISSKHYMHWLFE